MVVPLSYTDQKAWYGLVVNKTLDQVMGSVRKPLGIRLPDRRAIEYLTSLERDHLTNAAERYYNDERAMLDYRASGAQLNGDAVRVLPSEAGDDESFKVIHSQSDRFDEQRALKLAQEACSRRRP